MSPARRLQLTILATGILPLACSTISLSEEDDLGDAWAEQAQREHRIVDDSAVARYVTRLGTRLTVVADSLGRDWHFYVVDDSVVNAFAIPGGHIFINRGLIERAGSMSELAGVLAHEAAHVTLRHSALQIQSRQKTNVVVMAFCALTGWCSSSVAQVAINVGGEALFAKHSRADEAAADSAALRYVVAAGIDPRGVPRMFERLLAERQRSPTALDSWFGSHPLEESRVARTAVLIAEIPSRRLQGLQVDEPEFQSVRRVFAGERGVTMSPSLPR